VQVFPKPIQPSVSAPAGLETCADSDSLVLTSNYSGGNQWFRNGEIISGANDFIYDPSQSGSYQVQVTNSYGCSTISDAVDLVFYPLPASPIFYNNKNRLILTDTLHLPANYALQWFEYSAAIVGETGFQYCSNHTAEYGLEIIDLTTGCRNFSSQNIINDPLIDCTVGSQDITQQSKFSLSPNPTQDVILLQFDNILSVGNLIEVFDMQGRLMYQTNLNERLQQFQIDCAEWKAGVYTIKIGEKVDKFVVLK
jgi:hypothetical protein